MSEEFRASLDTLTSSNRPEVEKVLEALETEVSMSDVSKLKRQAGDAEYVGVPAPRGLLQGTPASADDLDRVLREVELRWRLDAVLAIGDYID